MRHVIGSLAVSVMVRIQHGRDCAVLTLPHQQGRRALHAQLGGALRLEPASARPSRRVDAGPRALEEGVLPGTRVNTTEEDTSPAFLVRFPVEKL